MTTTLSDAERIEAIHRCAAEFVNPPVFAKSDVLWLCDRVAAKGAEIDRLKGELERARIDRHSSNARMLDLRNKAIAERLLGRAFEMFDQHWSIEKAVNTIRADAAQIEQGE